VSQIGTPDYFGDRIHSYSGLYKFQQSTENILNGATVTTTLIDNRVGFLEKVQMFFQFTDGDSSFIIYTILDGITLPGCLFIPYNKYLFEAQGVGTWKHLDSNISNDYVYFEHIVKQDFNKSVEIKLYNGCGRDIGFKYNIMYKDNSV